MKLDRCSLQHKQLYTAQYDIYTCIYVNVSTFVPNCTLIEIHLYFQNSSKEY